MAFMPACMSTAGRIQSEFLRLLFIIADRGFFGGGGALGHRFWHRSGSGDGAWVWEPDDERNILPPYLYAQSLERTVLSSLLTGTLAQASAC